MEIAAKRGTTIHGAIQIWCETGDKALALAYAKDYAHWVEHLIDYRMWKTWKPLVNELRMIDRKRDIAGSCDVVLQHKETGMLCFCLLYTSPRTRDGLLARMQSSE